MNQTKKFYSYLTLISMLLSFSIVLKARRIRPEQRKITCVLFSLTAEQVFKKSNPIEIHQFLREKRFEKLFNPSCTIIECRSWRSLISKRNNVVFDATLTMGMIYLRKTRISVIFKTAIDLSKSIISENSHVSPKFVKNEIIDPSIWILISQTLETQIDLLATQSWMNRSGFIHSIKCLPAFRKTMLWYSTNSEPIHRIGEVHMERGLQIQTLNCFDAHLVWNSYQADFLESLGVHGVFVVGSIIFQPRIEIDLENSFFSILFTDVTPTSEESYFYNSQMSISTLQTIVDVVDEIKVESGIDIKLYLKPKRSYSTFHSKEYVNLVKSLIKSKKMILLHPNSNLYEVVSQSKFLISTPYTSTNFIASDLNIPSAYFCQNFDPWILEDTHHGFEVIISRTRLKSVLQATLFKK